MRANILSLTALVCLQNVLASSETHGRDDEMTKANPSQGREEESEDAALERHMRNAEIRERASSPVAYGPVDSLTGRACTCVHCGQLQPGDGVSAADGDSSESDEYDSEALARHLTETARQLFASGQSSFDQSASDKEANEGISDFVESKPERSAAVPAGKGSGEGRVGEHPEDEEVTAIRELHGEELEDNFVKSVVDLECVFCVLREGGVVHIEKREVEAFALIDSTRCNELVVRIKVPEDLDGTIEYTMLRLKTKDSSYFKLATAQDGKEAAENRLLEAAFRDNAFREDMKWLGLRVGELYSNVLMFDSTFDFTDAVFTLRFNGYADADKVQAPNDKKYIVVSDDSGRTFQNMGTLDLFLRVEHEAQGEVGPVHSRRGENEMSGMLTRIAEDMKRSADY